MDVFMMELELVVYLNDRLQQLDFRVCILPAQLQKQ